MELTVGNLGNFGKLGLGFGLKATYFELELDAQESKSAPVCVLSVGISGTFLECPDGDFPSCDAGGDRGDATKKGALRGGHGEAEGTVGDAFA